ncbi:MAG: cistern family PEP-CTERM protein [Sphingopyxis sp.]|uniref:cistern family PEP-CTERM protein n=1 Tax=Sphingopyxis sp. TaxID=1908224 RepID=UPI002ABCAE9C|nr:cistern family PEP-CTERM protein [Sphingopyxis sp.]MDZ3830362.1 cistern family PEP-CTERM protein [Sphingopyxis sp.]
MKLRLMSALAVLAIATSPSIAHADVITLGSGDIGNSFTVDYNGYTGSGTIAGLTAQIVFTLTSTTANSYTLSYAATNTSSNPITTSRISGFGFNTDPTLRGASSTGTFTVTAFNSNVPNVGSVDVCFKGGGGTKSCAGGGGGGVNLGGTGSGTLTLSFASPVSSLTLSDFFTRYQSITGAGSTSSAVGSGTISSTGGSSTGGTSTGGTPVPEPGMFGLFALGVGALLWRRRRTAAAPALAAA